MRTSARDSPLRLSEQDGRAHGGASKLRAGPGLTDQRLSERMGGDSCSRVDAITFAERDEAGCRIGNVGAHDCHHIVIRDVESGDQIEGHGVPSHAAL